MASIYTLLRRRFTRSTKADVEIRRRPGAKFGFPCGGSCRPGIRKRMPRSLSSGRLKCTMFDQVGLETSLLLFSESKYTSFPAHTLRPNRSLTRCVVRNVILETCLYKAASSSRSRCKIWRCKLMLNFFVGGGAVTNGASRSTSNTAADNSEGLWLLNAAVRAAGATFGDGETGVEGA